MTRLTSDEPFWKDAPATIPPPTSWADLDGKRVTLRVISQNGVAMVVGKDDEGNWYLLHEGHYGAL